MKVARDAIEFVGDEVKGDIIRAIICEGEIVTSLVVQPEDLESGAGEGGVARGVRWKWWFEIGMVAVGVRGTFCKPEGVLHGSRIETDSRQGTPELEAVFFLPSEDSRVGHCRVEEGKNSDEICVGGFVCCSCYLSTPSDRAKDHVEDSRRCAEQIGAIIGPGETRHCLNGGALCGVQCI